MDGVPETMERAESIPSRHWGVPLLWLLPALFLLAFVVYGVLTRPPMAPDDSAPRVGQPLADFTLPDLRGNRVQLSALRGKVVCINIWATWCPPCVEEMPTMQRLYDQLHERGLEVLAVSIDPLEAQVVGPFMQQYRLSFQDCAGNRRDPSPPFMRQYRLSFPALLDPEGRIERLYRTGGVPESFIVDKHGLLVEKVVGPRDWSRPQMITMFERLLDVCFINTPPVVT